MLPSAVLEASPVTVPDVRVADEAGVVTVDSDTVTLLEKVDEPLDTDEELEVVPELLACPVLPELPCVLEAAELELEVVAELLVVWSAVLDIENE